MDRIQHEPDCRRQQSDLRHYPLKEGVQLRRRYLAGEALQGLDERSVCQLLLMLVCGTEQAPRSAAHRAPRYFHGKAAFADAGFPSQEDQLALPLEESVQGVFEAVHFSIPTPKAGG